jgi:cytochrome P450 family 619
LSLLITLALPLSPALSISYFASRHFSSFSLNPPPDDWVDGHFLPAGTVVIINSWGLHHDATHFPDPDTFNPDHYANCTTLAPELATSSDYQNRDHYGYGSGRRICPGIHLAERNLFLAIAKLCWGFNISGKKGVEPDFDPTTGYSEGFLVCARPFECEITTRSEARKATIMREYEEVDREVLARYDSPPDVWGWSEKKE